MFSEMDKTNWYVLQTRSRFEKKCFDRLSAAGISVFLPIHTVRKKWSDRIKKVDEPLFPGYLFVQYSEADRYRILNTEGISRFITFGGKYACVHPSQMKAIEQILLANKNIEVVDTAINDVELTCGEEVLITTGAFKGNVARLVEYKGKGKLLLEITAIGKGILLEIGRTKVEQIPQFSKVS